MIDIKHIKINGKTNNNYLVDIGGNIFNTAGHKMALHKTDNGYLRVKLTKGCKRGMYLVHRIVAESYLENPDDMPIVNHLNSCRSDNRLVNLEWATNSINQLQRFRENGHKGTKCKAVKQIDPVTRNVVCIHESPIYAEKETGIARQNISKACLGLRKTAGGYAWEYEQIA